MPNTNTERYRGIQGVDITTGMNIFQPENSFRLAHELNKAGHDVKIEVYPTLDRRVISHIRTIGKKLGIGLPIPPGVTEPDIRKWQEKYPNSEVTRVHLPFSFNNAELWWLVMDPKTEPIARFHHLAWIAFIGGAQNMKGVEMAEKLADQNTGLTVHTNVIEGLAKTGKLEAVKRRVAFVLAENGMPYRSPVLKNKDAISDPATIMREIVRRYDVDGILLGADHLVAQGLMPHESLFNPTVVSGIRAMHLAEPKHDAMKAGRSSYEQFLRAAGDTEFHAPVRATLDFKPTGEPFQDQVKTIGRTIDWIMRTQGR